MGYEDLLNIDELWSKREYFKEERGWVAYYCKKCEHLVETTRPNPKWYQFHCQKCDSSEIVLGTKEWLVTNYKLKI